MSSTQHRALQRSRRIRGQITGAVLALVGICGNLQPARAQTAVTWNSTTSALWSTTGSWTGNALPANSLTTNYAQFFKGNTVTVTTDVSQSVAGLDFTSAAGNYTLSQTGGSQIVLTIGGYGIKTATASGNNTILTGSRLSMTIGAATSFEVNGGGNLTLSGSGTTPMLLNNDLTLGGTGAGSGTISSTMSGTGALTKSGSANWTLSGTSANTFSGLTTVTDGTLILNKTAGINAIAGAVTIGDGSVGTDTLQLAAANQIANTSLVTVKANGVFDLANSAETIGSLAGDAGAVVKITGASNITLAMGNTSATTYNGTFQNTGTGDLSLSKAGTGNLTLGGSSSYDGTTAITAGGIIVKSNNALGTAAGGTSITSGATLGFSGGVNYSTAEAITSVSGTGVGTNGAIQNIDGTNTFAGAITLAGGTTIAAAASSQLSLTGNVNLGTQAIIFGTGSNTGNIILSGNVNGTGTGTRLTVASGIVTLSNSTNSYQGNTVISNGGTLIVAAGNSSATLGALGDMSGTGNITTVSSGGTLGFQGNISYGIAEAVTAAGTGVGSQGAIQNLGGTNSFAGPITLSAAMTASAVAGSQLTLTGNVNMGTNAVTFGTGTNTGNIVLTGNVNGTGGAATKFTVDGGNVTLSNSTNSYQGNTVINSGATLIVAAGNSSATLGALGNASGTGNITVVNNGGTLGFQGGITYGIAEAVTANGTGVGGQGAIQNLAGTNSFAGPITLGSGATTASAVTGSQLTLTGNVNLSANRMTFGTSTSTGNMVVTGNVNGTGGITAAGGNVTLSNTTSTYSGSTIVTAGTLSIGTVADGGVNSSIGSSTNANTNLVLDGGTLKYTGASASTNRLFSIGTGGGTIDSSASSSGTLTFSNTTGSMGFNSQSGSRLLTLTGDSNGSIGAIIGDNGGATSLTKAGLGTWTLSGTNTMTGAIAVNAGTLSISGATAALGGTAGTTVASGAALALTGGASVSNGLLSLTGTGGGNGALTNISGTNTWTGNLTLTGTGATIGSQAGTLNIGNTRPSFTVSGHNQPTESGYITIGGQTLTFTGAGAIVVKERIQDNADQTAGTSYSNATTVSHSPQTTVDTGPFNPATPTPGNVTINMSGSGSVTFNANANTYTGTTTVQAGTLTLSTKNNSAAPHDPVTDSFHAINGPLVIGTGSAGGPTTALVQLGNGGGGANEVMGIGTTVSLFRDGTFRLNLNAQTIDTLTFTGGTVEVGDGALYLNKNVVVNASSGNTASITGATGSMSLTLDRNVTADTGPDAERTFTVAHGANNTTDLSISAVVTNGSLIKAGTGTMMMNALNTYTGYTSVTGGILNIQSGTSGTISGLGDSAGLVDNTQATYVNVDPTTHLNNSNSGTLQLQGGISITTEKLFLAGNGHTAVDSGQGSGVLGALNNLSGNNVWGTTSSGALITLADNARINSSAGLLTIASNIDSGGSKALTVGGAGNTTISGQITTGSGTTATVTKDGAGTLILSGLNDYAGATNVTQGVLSLQHNSGLGAVTTGSDGTFVTGGAELQLSNAANGNLSVGGEALTINGSGISGLAGALHNVAGNNTFGGLVTLGSTSTIKSDSATTLTLSGGTTTGGNSYGLVIAGAGNTTISGNMTNSSGTLTKNDSGTFTFARSTVGLTTGTVGATHLNAGNMTVGDNTSNHITQLSTGAFDSATSTVLTVAAGSKVTANYTSGTTYFQGSMAGSGEFQKDGSGTLAFTSTFTASNLTLTLNGGTVLLGRDINNNIISGGNQLTFGTIHITGDTILDFGGSAGTFLSSTSLVIDAGVNVTVNNWISVANTTSSSTAWYVRAGTPTVNAGTLGGTDIVGGTPLNQIAFTNYNGLSTTWVSTNHNGWFDHEIRPTPEPATYGAIFFSGCLGLLGWRRYQRRKSASV